jgi:hypothetical protein
MPRREIEAGNLLPGLIPPDEKEVHIPIEIGMALCLLVEYYCFKMKMTVHTVFLSVVFLFFYSTVPPSQQVGCQPFWARPELKEP